MSGAETSQIVPEVYTGMDGERVAMDYACSISCFYLGLLLPLPIGRYVIVIL